MMREGFLICRAKCMKLPSLDPIDESMEMEMVKESIEIETNVQNDLIDSKESMEIENIEPNEIEMNEKKAKKTSAKHPIAKKTKRKRKPLEKLNGNKVSFIGKCDSLVPNS